MKFIFKFFFIFLVFLFISQTSKAEQILKYANIDRIIKEKKKPYIFACGPEPMLVAIRDYSLKNNIPTQLSVESYMGCGVGLCQGCVISKNRTDKKENSYHEQYSLVCIDGPVYEAKDIRFD